MKEKVEQTRGLRQRDIDNVIKKILEKNSIRRRQLKRVPS